MTANSGARDNERFERERHGLELHEIIDEVPRDHDAHLEQPVNQPLEPTQFCSFDVANLIKEFTLEPLNGSLLFAGRWGHGGGGFVRNSTQSIPG